MNKNKSILWLAISIALAFTFSCSSDDDGGGGEIGPCSGGEVKIGTQTWQKCNLDVVPSTGTHKCYDNDPANCTKYGRLYSWATAMALPSSCDSTTCSDQILAKHKGICPSGWHIPSSADWDVLMKSINSICSEESSISTSSSTVRCSGAGTKLKAKNGWSSNATFAGMTLDGIPGTDNYGFSALPGGLGGSGGGDAALGIQGYWWTSSENGSNYVYNIDMQWFTDSVERFSNANKVVLRSIRCVKD